MPLFEIVEVINETFFRMIYQRVFKKPLILLNQSRLFQFFKILQSRYKIQNKSHIVQKNFHRFHRFLLHKVYILIRTDDIQNEKKNIYIYIYIYKTISNNQYTDFMFLYVESP